MFKGKNILASMLIKRSEFDTQGRGTRTAYQVIESDKRLLVYLVV
jgi:hypothetical protein